MGRYRAERVIVRDLPELVIVFWDWSSIYIQPKSGMRQWYVFHKYHAPLGTYTNSWRPFKRRLMKTKALTFEKCCQLAVRYNILAKGAVGRLHWEQRPVEIRFGKIRIKGIGNDVQDML